MSEALRRKGLKADGLLALVRRREKALRKALRFAPRLCADEPDEAAQRVGRAAARRYCMPLGKDGGTLAEGGLESELLDFDGKSATARFVISAVRRDRHGDVVRPRGCLGTLADYARNPQVFFAHASDCYPVATAGDPKAGELDLEVEDDQILSAAHFHLKTQESQDVCELVDAGILKAASIGFFPLVGDVIDAAMSDDELEGAATVNFDFGGFDFTEWSLVEWSVVPVPANPDALRGHLSRAKKMSAGVRRSLEPQAVPVSRSRPRPCWYDLVAGAGRSPLPKPPSPQTKMPPTPDPTPDLQDRPGTGPAPDAEAGRDGQEAQAVVLSPQRFHSVDEVAQWLAENGYAADNIVPGDEADEPWVAVQFPADRCEAGTGHRDEVEEGVYVVFCQCKPDADRDYPDGAEGNQEQSPPVSEPKNAATPHAKADPSELPLRGVDEAADSENEHSEEESQHLPHGAQVIKALHGHLKAAFEHLKAEHPRMEETPAKKFVYKMLGHVHKAMGTVCEAGAKHYPEHLGDLETPELDGHDAAEDAHDGEKDEEASGVTLGRAAARASAKMAKKDVGVVADAAEFLTELTGHAGLKKTERSAAKLHATELSSLQQKYAKPAEEAEAAKLAVAEEKALQEFLSGADEIKRIYFELTGQEL